MASILKRGKHQYQVQIRRKHVPQPLIRTFSTRAEAEQWARETESQIDRGQKVIVLGSKEASHTSLAQALQRYKQEKTPLKLSWRSESGLIKRWLAHPLSAKMLTELDSGDFAKYRDDRLRAGKALATVRKELNLISNLYNVARLEWKMRGLPNPLTDVKKPPAWAKPRKRRFNDRKERVKLFEAMGRLKCFTNNRNQLKRLYAVKAAQFALETGMRRGEVCNLRWPYVHLDKDYIEVVRPAHLNAELKGGDRDVLLSKSAVKILRSLPTPIPDDDRVFPVAPAVLTKTIRDARRAAGLTEDVILHVFRHEATSNLFERGLTPIEVADQTGHRSLDTLRRYTHPDREAVRRKLG